MVKLYKTYINSCVERFLKIYNKMHGVFVIVIISTFIFFKCVFLSAALSKSYHYNIKFLFFNAAGKQLFKITKENSSTTLYLEIKSSPFFSTFYKLHDKITTSVDNNTLLPLHIEKYTHEGNYKSHSLINFDYNNKKVYLIERLLPSGEIHNKRVILLPQNIPTFDLLSFIYYLTQKEIKRGKTMEIGLLSRFDVKRANVNILNADVNTYLVIVKAITGRDYSVTDKDYMVKLWIDKKTKEVVKIFHRLKWGAVYANLIK